jgi:hypothetical protein
MFLKLLKVCKHELTCCNSNSKNTNYTQNMTNPTTHPQTPTPHPKQTPKSYRPLPQNTNLQHKTDSKSSPHYAVSQRSHGL